MLILYLVASLFKNNQKVIISCLGIESGTISLKPPNPIVMIDLKSPVNHKKNILVQWFRTTRQNMKRRMKMARAKMNQARTKVDLAPS